MLNLFRVVLLSVILIVKTNHAAFAAENPENVIKQIFELAKEENLGTKTDVKNKLETLIDFDQMALNILGNEATKRNATQVKWFQKSIKEIITKSVYPEAPAFLNGVKITYRTTILDGNKATVPSVVSKKGEKTDVGYKLVLANDSWKVIDISIDDESWTKTISQSVQKTLNEKGWAGLESLLNKKLVSLNTKNPKK